jgi:hypothetical protein
MGRITPKTVSELMDVANRFADEEDACNNKRTRSPEDDRRNIYESQRRRSRNYDNHGYHSQVLLGDYARKELRRIVVVEADVLVRGT